MRTVIVLKPHEPIRPLMILVLVLSVLSVGLLPQCTCVQSYDYVYQEIDAETRIVSPREARVRYTVSMKNLQIKELKSWTPSLDSRLVSSGYTITITRVYDSTGELNYDFTPGKTSGLRVIFRKTVSPGESCGFSYEFTAKWDYNSYSWWIGWSTSTIIEKIKLKISVTDQLRIVRTGPAGAFSDDRKSAETQATNLKEHSLWASYPLTSGKRSALALLVEFRDVKHKASREEISRRIFQEMNSYFKEVSFDQISVTGDVTDWIMLPKSAATYNISQWGSLDRNRRAFQDDVIKTADEFVDYSRYDVIFIVAAGAAGQTVWGHSHTRMIRTRDNTTIEYLTVQAEEEPCGTFAHEFGHVLGLPDLYDYEMRAKPGIRFESAIHVGRYDLMSIHVDLPHLMGWNRLALGWIPARNLQLVNPGDVRSVRVSQLESLSGIVLVKVPISAKQYYLFEARERIGYDSVLPHAGVLVTYVDESVESGKGPARLVDANPSTDTLDDAPFNLGAGENSVFASKENKFGFVILQKGTDGYLIHFTKPESVNEAREWALEASSRIEQVEKEIVKAKNEGRLEGLDDAMKGLEQAKNRLTQANYREAAELASKALAVAQKATQPVSSLMLWVGPVIVIVLVAVLAFWKVSSVKKRHVVSLPTDP